MPILSVDTSGKSGSIALVKCDAQALRTLELVPLEGGTFSAQLVPQIVGLLQRQGLTKYQIDGFAVVTGPGSFTGLRVGLAAIKALAEVLHKPIMAISLLEAVAVAGCTAGHVLAGLDAGRGEVYCAEYDVVGLGAVGSTQHVVCDREFPRVARGLKVITPDERVLGLLTSRDVATKLIPRPRADLIAQIGFTKMADDQTVTPEALDASYIRRSDAEITLSTTRG